MEGQISTIRLIKFVYLIDLEYSKHNGETLTGIHWVFYKYGPYFFEVGDILRSASIDLDATEVTTSRGKGFTFRAIEEQSISRLFDYATEQQINRIIKKWALEDTDVLLDFVYKTPPIVLGKRGSALDFGLATPKKEKKSETGLKVSNPTAYRLMLASEKKLAEQWDNPEEDEAWAHLSKGK